MNNDEPKKIAIIPVKMMHNFGIYDRVFSTMEKVAGDGRKRHSFLKSYIKYDFEAKRFVSSNGPVMVTYDNSYLEELPQGDAYYVYKDGLLQQVEFNPNIQKYLNYERLLNPQEQSTIKLFTSYDETNSEALFTLTNHAAHNGVFLAGRQMLLLTKVGLDLRNGTMSVWGTGTLNCCKFNSESIPGMSVVVAGLHDPWRD